MGEWAKQEKSSVPRPAKGWCWDVCVWSIRVAEGEGQGPPCHLFKALAQKAEELGLEDTLQEAVRSVLLEDEEVVLSCAGERREKDR